MKFRVGEGLFSPEEVQDFLDDPVVAAVVELTLEARRQYRRAEAAHEAKDEANRRWLKLANRD